MARERLAEGWLRAAVRLGLFLAIFVPAPLFAAEFARMIDDRAERPGIPFGVFRLTPEVSSRVSHDDNIFREPSGGTASMVLRVEPQVALVSGWRRHSVSLQAGAVLGQFSSSPEDDYIDAGIQAKGTLDATRATRARLTLSLNRAHEARGSDDAPRALARPVRFLHYGAEITAQYDPGRLRIQPSIGFERLDFQDVPLGAGGIADQDDRDRGLTRLGLLVGWRLVGSSELFAEGVFSSTDFQDQVDRNGFDRDNHSFRMLAGARLNLSRLISGRLAAGWEQRVYTDPALRDFSGPVIEAALSWEPSRLITLDLTAGRRIEETTIPRAAATDVSSLQIRARWAIRRTIALTAETGIERRDFRGISRTDDLLILGIGTVLRVSRHAEMEAGIRHERERSNIPGEGHKATQVWLGARYAF
jgi:hypothetical protein